MAINRIEARDWIEVYDCNGGVAIKSGSIYRDEDNVIIIDLADVDRVIKWIKEAKIAREAEGWECYEEGGRNGNQSKTN